MRRAAFLLVSPALAFYLVILALPFAFLLLLSFSAGSPGGATEYTFKQYLTLFSDGYFYKIYLRTLLVATITTVVAVLIGTFEAIILFRMREPWRTAFLLVAIGPLLISVVVRTLGWTLLFGSEGLLNLTLMRIGLISSPIPFLFTTQGVVVALVHVLTPFVVLSVWASMQRMDMATENAAKSLGASDFTVLRRILIPQIMPGILSGMIVVFALAASAFATPAIIGGRRLKTVATAAYDEFLGTQNWPLGAALTLVLLVFTVTILIGLNRWIERRYSAMFRKATS
nr:ABC transporter permease [uncultured Shinella sp.]